MYTKRIKRCKTENADDELSDRQSESSEQAEFTFETCAQQQNLQFHPGFNKF